MDDLQVVLGMEFFDKMDAIAIPSAKTMCIREDGHTSLVPLSREVSGSPNMLAAMQLFKAVKKDAQTFLVSLKEEAEEGGRRFFPKSSDVFQDVMPAQRPSSHLRFW